MCGLARPSRTDIGKRVTMTWGARNHRDLDRYCGGMLRIRASCRKAGRMTTLALSTAPGEQVPDRCPRFVGRMEMLLVEIPDVILNGEKLQPVFIRNDNSDGFAVIFDNLLAHVITLPRAA